MIKKLIQTNPSQTRNYSPYAIELSHNPIRLDLINSKLDHIESNLIRSDLNPIA